MPSYEQNKEFIYNWREKNKEKHRELSKIHMRNYRLKLQNWKEIKFEFLNILLIV